MLEEARNEPRSRNLPQSDSEKKSTVGTSGENPRENPSRRASGENTEIKQQGCEDSEKNTKIWSNDEERTEKSKANSRQKSKANSRQKSIANGRQSKPKDCDRDKAKYEEKRSTEESCSQPVPKYPRTDADVQQGQQELKLGEVIKTTPTIDFNEESWRTRKSSRQLRNSDLESPDQRSRTSRRILSH